MIEPSRCSLVLVKTLDELDGDDGDDDDDDDDDDGGGDGDGDAC